MTPIRVNRGELLQTLQAVEAGLSPRDILQQSNSFVFRNGYVQTFNDEVSCRAKSPFPKGAEFAVPSGPLTRVLTKMPEDYLTAKLKDADLVLIGKARGLRVTVDREIVLSLDSVERPGKEDWQPLPPDFGDAVTIVGECVSKDQSQTAISCVHFHPKWVEACDGLQVARYRIRTGIESPFLVKRDGLRFAAKLGMTKMALTETWVHFKNPTGIVLSCRRYDESFPSDEIRDMFKVEGAEHATLPKGLGTATEVAEIFSAENKDDNFVLVELSPGRVRVKGVGVTGRYWEDKKAKYHGKPMSFLISPRLLVEITKRHDRVEVTKDRLLANGGKWRYLTALGSPDVIEKKAERLANEEGG
jgi:hypothetical protein